MSTSFPPQGSFQSGGLRKSMIEEIKETAGAFLLLGLILVSVYVSRIPPGVLSWFQTAFGQSIGLLLVIGITASYGWIHGILVALAYALVVSHATRQTKEAFQTSDVLPSVVLPDSQETVIVPKNHRWFVEKVLGETPFLIRDKEVETSAVQDLSERGMGTNSASFSR